MAMLPPGLEGSERMVCIFILDSRAGQARRSGNYDTEVTGMVNSLTPEQLHSESYLALRSILFFST